MESLGHMLDALWGGMTWRSEVYWQYPLDLSPRATSSSKDLITLLLSHSHHERARHIARHHPWQYWKSDFKTEKHPSGCLSNRLHVQKTKQTSRYSDIVRGWRDQKRYPSQSWRVLLWGQHQSRYNCIVIIWYRHDDQIIGWYRMLDVALISWMYAANLLLCCTQ